MSATTSITETDYRAWLAFLWTAVTAGVIILMLFKGYSVTELGTILSALLPLDAVFINSYFKSKEN